MRYFQNYWGHELWCTLEGLPLPTGKLSTKKRGRKKKNQEKDEEIPNEKEIKGENLTDFA